MRLADKVAIVVGAGQQAGDTIGNGRATAIRFAQEGAKVLCVDIDEALAQDTVDMIAKEGGEASALKADITREADCKAIADTCVERYGRIDILHNNVGRAKGDAPTPDIEEAMWDELMNMNLKGMVMTCKHVLRVMREQKSGSIINISSVNSYAICQGVTYKCSKAAVNALSNHMAIENAPYGVRSNVILPGLIDTPMAIIRRAQERGVDPDVVRKQRLEQVPLKTDPGSAWDIANAAVFLASDEARYVSGVEFPVDGAFLRKII